MERVTIHTEPAYDALVGRGLLDRAGEETAKVLRGRALLLVTDEHVALLYLARVKASFAAAGFRPETYVIGCGEAWKTLSTVERVLEAADAACLTRSDFFCALGGGVVGDLTGLCAALYLRGWDFVQIPTTLLAMADASVGGKTAVNLSGGKNLCGAFHQPRLVLCDLDTLASLPAPVYAEGMAEVIKHGALGGGTMLDLIRAGTYPEKMIAENIRIKSSIVSRDERESGLRQLLNFGHTFGHAIEKLSGYTIYHGEGVSVGMMIAACAAEKAGRCTPEVRAELRDMLKQAGLPVTTCFTAAEVARAARNDKKRRGDGITVVLPAARGQCELVCLPVEELEGLIACCDGEVTAR